MSSRPFSVILVDSTTTFGGNYEVAVELCESIHWVEGLAAHLISARPRELLDARLKGVLPCLHLSGRPWMLLTRPEVAEEFGRAARASCVERFSAPVIARQHLDLYHEVAGRP